MTKYERVRSNLIIRDDRFPHVFVRIPTGIQNRLHIQFLDVFVLRMPSEKRSENYVEESSLIFVFTSTCRSRPTRRIPRLRRRHRLRWTAEQFDRHSSRISNY